MRSGANIKTKFIWTILVGIFLLILVSINATKLKPSLYENVPTLDGVYVQLEVDYEHHDILYSMKNKTGMDIVYDPCIILEYYDDGEWNEVLTKLGYRASEKGGDLVASILPATSSSAALGLNIFHLENLSFMPKGNYRLLFSTLDPIGYIMVSETFYWGPDE